MSPTVRALLDRAMLREPFDEHDLAATLIDTIQGLEDSGAITCRYRFLRRFANLVPPTLRGELFLAVGVRSAGVAE